MSFEMYDSINQKKKVSQNLDFFFFFTLSGVEMFLYLIN